MVAFDGSCSLSSNSSCNYKTSVYNQPSTIRFRWSICSVSFSCLYRSHFSGEVGEKSHMILLWGCVRPQFIPSIQSCVCTRVNHFSLQDCMFLFIYPHTNSVPQACVQILISTPLQPSLYSGLERAFYTLFRRAAILRFRVVLVKIFSRKSTQILLAHSFPPHVWLK